MKELRAFGWEISDEALQKGFAAVTFPARMEVMSEHPVVILDGAHNPEGTGALAKAIKKYVSKKRMIGVCGMMADKTCARPCASWTASWRRCTPWHRTLPAP